MAKAKQVDESSVTVEGMSAFEGRLVRLVGLMVVQGQKFDQQVDLLTRAGFPSAEVAGLLGQKAQAVADAKYRNKKASKGSKAKKPGKN